jgi:hypothetical protein
LCPSLQGQHAFAMQCFLRISPQAAFEFLESALSSPRISKGRTSELVVAVDGMVEELVAADNIAFARLVLKYLPERHTGFLAKLQSNPELQYRWGQFRAYESRNLDDNDCIGSNALQRLGSCSGKNFFAHQVFFVWDHYCSGFPHLPKTCRAPEWLEERQLQAPNLYIIVMNNTTFGCFLGAKIVRYLYNNST